jgi:hypothetical protein
LGDRDDLFTSFQDVILRNHSDILTFLCGCSDHLLRIRMVMLHAGYRFPAECGAILGENKAATPG